MNTNILAVVRCIACVIGVCRYASFASEDAPVALLWKSLHADYEIAVARTTARIAYESSGIVKLVGIPSETVTGENAVNEEVDTGEEPVYVVAVCIAPNGDVTGELHNNKRVLVRRWRNGKASHSSVRLPDDDIYSRIAMAPDSNRLIVSGGKTLTVIELETMSVKRIANNLDYHANSLAFDSSAKMFAVGLGIGGESVRLYDAVEYTQFPTLEGMGRKKAGTGIAVENSKQFASVGFVDDNFLVGFPATEHERRPRALSGEILIWSTLNQKQTNRIQLPQLFPVSFIKLFQESKILILCEEIGSANDKTLILLDFTRGTIIGQSKLQSEFIARGKEGNRLNIINSTGAGEFLVLSGGSRIVLVGRTKSVIDSFHLNEVR